MKLVKVIKEVRYFCVVNNSNLFNSFEVVRCFCLFFFLTGEKKYPVYDETHYMLHNKLLSLFIQQIFLNVYCLPGTVVGPQCRALSTSLYPQSLLSAAVDTKTVKISLPPDLSPYPNWIKSYETDNLTEETFRLNVREKPEKVTLKLRAEELAVVTCRCQRRAF